MKSIFEKITDKEIPGYIIWENTTFIAFLAKESLTRGHALVVPKTNYGDYIFDLEDQVYSELMKNSKIVANLIQSKLDCERVLMWVEGFSVPHVHVHLIPAKQNFGILKAQILDLGPEDFLEIQRQILL